MSDHDFAVLIVDDDKLQADGLAEWLWRKEKVEVDVAVSGEYALDLMHKTPGKYGVVLLDQVFPAGWSGDETLRRIKEEFPDVFIVMLTQETEEGGIEALRLGAYRSIIKPINNQEVRILIRHIGEIRDMERRLRLERQLLEISRLALSGNYKKLADYITLAVSDLTGTDVSLWMIEATPEGPMLHIHAGQGLLDDYQKTASLSLDPKLSVVATCLADKLPRPKYDIFDDTELPLFYFKDQAILQGWKSFLAVPLLSSTGDPLGALSIYSCVKRHFSEAEENLLTTFANQAAMALENIRLMTELRTRQEHLERLVTTGGAVTHETASGLKPVLEKVAESACKLVGAKCAAIYPYNPEKKLFYDSINVVVYGATRRTPKEKPRASGLAAIVRNIDELIVYDVDQGELGEIDYTQMEPGVDSVRLVEIIQEEKFVREEGVKAFIGISLRTGVSREGKADEEVGVLYIDFDTPRDFAPQELALIRIFAHQAASAIQTARLLVNSQHQVQTHKDLNSVGTRLAGLLVEEAVLDEVASSAAKVIDCTHCSVFRLEGKVLVLETAKGNLAAGLQPERLFKLGKGIAGWVAKYGNPLLVPNTNNDSRFEPGWSKSGNPQSLAVMPILLDGNVYGVISVEHDRTEAFDEQDQRVLETLAQQASLAIQNARQIKRLSTLNQVGHELSEKLDPAAIYDTVVKAAVQILECTHCTAFVLENDLLVPQTSYGREVKPIKISRRFALGEGLVGLVAQTGKSLLTPNAKKEPTFAPGKTRPRVQRSMTVVPIKIEGRVAGVISADQDRINAFVERDKEIVETLAQQAGIALQNARLFEQVKQRLDDLQQSIQREQAKASQLERLHQVLDAMNRTHDPDEILPLLVKGINDLVGGNVSSVVNLFDFTKGVFVSGYAAGPCKELLEKGLPRKEGGVSITVLQSGEPLFIDNAESHHLARREGLTEGMRSFACLPLVLGEQSAGHGELGEEALGTLYVRFEEPHHFSAEEIPTMKLFASEAAVVLQNVRLYAEARRRLAQVSTLLENNERIITVGVSDADHLFDALYDVASEVMDLDNAQVQFALYDVETDKVSFPLALEKDDGNLIDMVRWGKRELGSGQTEVDAAFQPRKRGDRFGLTEYVIHKRETVFIPADFWETANALRINEQAVRVLPEFGLRKRSTHSWLGVPMIVQGRVIGIISIQSLEQERAFTQEQVDLLTIVANQAAVAIENANLYATIKDAVQRVAEAERVKTVSEFTADFGHLMNNMAGTMPIRVSIIEERLAANTEIDPEVLVQLKGLRRDASQIMDASKELKRSTESRPAEAVSTNDLLDIAIDRVRHSEPGVAKVIFRRGFAPDLPPIRVERNKLLDTFVNIIRNGVQAMPEGGTLTVSSLLSRSPNGSCVEVLISDTGIGIPQENLPRVFTLFFTTKPNGLGYGLWRDRGFVRALGGDISVASEAGQGATFTLRLPVGLDAQEQVDLPKHTPEEDDLEVGLDASTR